MIYHQVALRFGRRQRARPQTLLPLGQAKLRVAFAYLLAGVIGGGANGSVVPPKGAALQEPAVQLYTKDQPPLTPSLEQLPRMKTISKDGITWTFSQEVPVGQFVNGDYYVVGEATVVDIQPLPTPSNGRHGSMLNIQPNRQRSGFDDRLASGRYEPALRVYPPITLTPGNKLVSSRSADSSLPAVMRPFDTAVSPVASVSILTSVDAPQPPDAFRPSYAQGAQKIYRSRDLSRDLLPTLPQVENVPALAEFEAYLRRPWIDSVFFNFDVPAEYMPSYGRENGYVMSFAGLLLTLDFPPAQKESLLIYLVQYGIDLFGLVENGHPGWPAQGGHGTGRKFPILLAGCLLNEPKMKDVSAAFGEDMQTIWVTETPPAGTYTQSWHSTPAAAVYAGHAGIGGESISSGWGPYEHLPPPEWKSILGEQYRRCCTSACWIGEALAARLIPGMEEAWNHPQFFAYVDRWMTTADDPQDRAAIEAVFGYALDNDFLQGQAWGVLRGGGYNSPQRAFVDEMWAAYRSNPRIQSAAISPEGAFVLTADNLVAGRTHFIWATTNVPSASWTTIFTNIPTRERWQWVNPRLDGATQRFYRIQEAP